MVSIMQSYMDVESSRQYIDELYSSDGDKCLQAVVHMKNSVIGSNRQKSSVIQQGVVPRLLQLLVSPPELTAPSTADLQVETVITLGSLAMGTEENVKEVVDAGAIPLLINGLGSSNPELVEVCLRCLRTISRYPRFLSSDLFFNDPSLIPHMVSLLPQSHSNHVCVATILSVICKTADHQNILCRHGAVEQLAILLHSHVEKVQRAALDCLSSMCYRNAEVATIVANYNYNEKSILDRLVELVSRDRPPEIQQAAARCAAYLHRAGVINADDPRIMYKALPCLVRMCKKEHDPDIRILAAGTLAYLTEVDTELQRTASISNHLIGTMAEFFKYQPSVANGATSGTMTNYQVQQMSRKLEKEARTAQEMKQAAYQVFASLAANDEDIRKKILETDTLMKNIVQSLQDPDVHIRLAAVRCLHSLSRSVQQLRTTFQDHIVWKPLMKLLQTSADDMLTAASSTLCNLLLEFSPSKEAILESGAMDLLCSLTRNPNPALRLNGVWALMNMAFQADQKVKTQILNTLGTEQIECLLNDTEEGVLMKTLGLLRNLLSTKPHIDYIMNLRGKVIMQSVMTILDNEEHGPDVQEQALCILANIADGDLAKEHIMDNETVPKKLMNYMTHPNVKLQIAATFCVCNLVWSEEEGAVNRQAKLKELGIFKLLQQMLTTSDTTLFEKVKTALQQFS